MDDIFGSCLNHEPQITDTNGKNASNSPDFFDSSVTLEKSHIEEGYTDGYKQGLVAGRQDGYEVGLKHGFESGEELGFYRGLVDVWLAAIRIEPDCFSARIRKTIQQMKELLDKYPLMDPEDESKDDVLEGLRLKFRAVSATLGVKLEYNGYPNKSDPQEIDF